VHLNDLGSGIVLVVKQSMTTCISSDCETIFNDLAKELLLPLAFVDLRWNTWLPLGRGRRKAGGGGGV